MEQLPTPHNNFFHFALSHLPNARSLIESQLSYQALAELDLDSLQLQNGSFVDSDLREKFSDLLFSMRLKPSSTHDNDEALVYFLFEHKSQTDTLTVIQLLSYIVRIWEKRLRDELPLCPIVPLVVYHGESGWTAARSLADLIPTPEGLQQYQIQFSLPLLDLHQLNDENIDGSPILRSTLGLLKYSRSKHLLEKLGEFLHWIAQSLPEGALPRWIEAIGVYVMSVNRNIDSQQYKQTLKSVFPTQFEPGSLADRLLTQGREEGRDEGREEGREEGMQRGVLAGKIQLLQELLGDVPNSQAELQVLDLDSLSLQLSRLQERLRRPRSLNFRSNWLCSKWNNEITMSEIGWVIDTTDETFAVDVFERSKQGLVVVDFWAEWCAPCRTLGPILEKLAEEYAGKFTLVKANTENNQEAAGQFNVSGIPAVFAVDDGSVIDSFQGAMPEPAIRSWLDKLLSLGSITGTALRLVQTDPVAAELQLRAILEQTPTNTEAQIALADALLQQSRLDECRAVIEQLEERGFLESSAEKVKAALALKSKSGGDLEKLRAAAAEDSKNFAAQLALAEALAGEQAYIESFEICLDLVMRDRKRTGEKARELMVEVFRVLPDDSPLTSEYRRKLSSALY